MALRTGIEPVPCTMRRSGRLLGVHINPSLFQSLFVKLAILMDEPKFNKSLSLPSVVALQCPCLSGLDEVGEQPQHSRWGQLATFVSD